MEDLRQTELTPLDDHAKCKKNSTIQAQWAGNQSVKAIRSDCESLKNCLEDVLGKFDGSYGLEELFQTMVDQYKDVFDGSVELNPMIGPKYEIELKDELIRLLHLNVPRKTPFAL